jgi:hypothetical protein
MAGLAAGTIVTVVGSWGGIAMAGAGIAVTGIVVARAALAGARAWVFLHGARLSAPCARRIL